MTEKPLLRRAQDIGLARMRQHARAIYDVPGVRARVRLS
jgi:hypothetical protein